MKPGLRRTLLLGLAAVGIPILGLATIEGLSSFYLARVSFRLDQRAEIGHIERDTLLGWINLPNVRLPDYYAPGVGVVTNDQQFRHAGHVSPTPAPGHRRVICSGGSFTFGYGVNEDQTWCHLFSRDDSLVESVNMGEGGFGIDQSYLWYVRDGLPLHPSIHVFAFVGWEFHRMRIDRFQGEPKPRLAKDAAGVHAIGVPVPSPGFGPTALRLRRALTKLRSFTLVQAFAGERATPADPMVVDEPTWALAEATLRDLQRRDSIAGTQLVVVFLPMKEDRSGNATEGWRKRLHDASARGEFTFLDLVEPFRRLPEDSVAAMFLTAESMPFPAAAGHYTAQGNAWVAGVLEHSVPGLLTSSRPGIASSPGDGHH